MCLAALVFNGLRRGMAACLYLGTCGRLASSKHEGRGINTRVLIPCVLQGWSLDALLGLFAPAGGLSPAGVLPDGFGSGLPPATVPASPPATTAAAADMRGAQQISGCSDLSASSWTPLNSTVPGLLDSSWQLLPALAHTSESPLAATQQVHVLSGTGAMLTARV